MRRPDHYPEGTLSLESAPGSPANTIVRHIPDGAPMTFSIDAATKVSFTGERYLHALLATQFDETPAELTLVARARQFSSFILLVGKIDGPGSFKPEHGIILQNKDELQIAIMLEQMPTPKEFRDAISSLSPEQQRFCKAFRAMQLEGSVFGVCLIQLKPQLEKLLNLPPDALTKEIRLTQDLLELFIDYQIPSDLLTFGGKPDAKSEEKLAAVKEHVANVMSMIQEERDREVALAKQTAEAEKARREREREEEKSYPEPRWTMKKGGHAARQMRQDDEIAVMEELEENEMSMDMMMSAPMARMAAPMAMMSAPMASSAAAPYGGEPQREEAPAPRPQQSDPVADDSEGFTEVTEADLALEDFTQVPRALDKKFEALDTDSALRPTRIKCGPEWQKKEQRGLVGNNIDHLFLEAEEQAAEKARCFDLLDAISQSGAVTITDATLHVVVAATHRFGKSVLDCVVKDNVNPIEKMERSALIVASVVHGKTPVELIGDEGEARRIAQNSQNLFIE